MANIELMHGILLKQDKLLVIEKSNDEQYEKFYIMVDIYFKEYMMDECIPKYLNHCIKFCIEGYENAKVKYPNRDKIYKFFKKMSQLINDNILIEYRENVKSQSSWTLSYDYEQNYVELVKK